MSFFGFYLFCSLSPASHSSFYTHVFPCTHSPLCRLEGDCDKHTHKHTHTHNHKCFPKTRSEKCRCSSEAILRSDISFPKSPLLNTHTLFSDCTHVNTMTDT